ncbi:MAG TPA: HEAT repeat domain-containing protein [Pirellulaceae bacterium]|nr:HEAT repeat domain-containing protein [Pirellulaceae bacterium]
MNRTLLLLIACLLLQAPTSQSAEPLSPIEKYQRLAFPPKEENFEEGWKDRVAADYDVINSADLTSLRAALQDDDPFVRAIAAYALGVRSDRTSADAIAELVKNDKEYVVRIRAVEALALLKMKPEVIEASLKDREPGVPFVAKLVAGQLQSEIDYAAEIRQAYAAGIDRPAMGSAVVGKPAPDFTALTIDRKPFQLSSVLGRKPIAIYFTAFDG